MSLEDSQFFSDNIKNINTLASRIFIFILAVPVLFMIGTFTNLFKIPYKFSIIMMAISLTVCFIELILIRNSKTQRLAMYFGLISINCLVSLMGMNSHVGIYISYGVIPFIACLYFDLTVTKVIGITSYVLMIVSLWFRSRTIYLTDVYSNTPDQWFYPVAAGFTIEYLIVYLSTKAITKRTSRTLSESIDAKYKAINANIQLKNTQYKIIEFVASCLGSHDLFTGHHVQHTKKYVELICRKLVEKGLYTDILTTENIELYSSAAFLHDIGKIHVPEGVLNKVGRFNDEEFKLMQSHPDEGRKLLEVLPQIDEGKFNKIAIDMAWCHHEKFNGTGYPRRLKAYDIPLCARIMAAADVLDALISKRLYKEPMAIDTAMNIFEQEKGQQFEPCIADAVIELKDEIEVIDANFKAVESEQDEQELQWWLEYHSKLKEA